jgi:ubiquinone/menaquinone biosynthesis C-methylase UbiE
MLIKAAHQRYVATRRVRVLVDHLAEMLPQGLRILDVGCGDGLLAHCLMEKRPDLIVVGIDVVPRAESFIPVEMFDGKLIPYPDQSFDGSLLIDVLHHTMSIAELLREAVRVSRQYVAIKDHTAAGRIDRRQLTFMDAVGNKRFGVSLPNNYLSREQWDAMFKELNLQPANTRTSLHIYPCFADWLFGRSLHVLGLFEVPSRRESITE